MCQENRVNRGTMLLTAVTYNLQFYEVHTTIAPPTTLLITIPYYRHTLRSNSWRARWLGMVLVTNS